MGVESLAQNRLPELVSTTMDMWEQLQGLGRVRDKVEYLQSILTFVVDGIARLAPSEKFFGGSPLELEGLELLGRFLVRAAYYQREFGSLPMHRAAACHLLSLADYVLQDIFPGDYRLELPVADFDLLRQARQDAGFGYAGLSSSTENEFSPLLQGPSLGDCLRWFRRDRFRSVSPVRLEQIEVQEAPRSGEIEMESLVSPESGISPVGTPRPVGRAGMAPTDAPPRIPMPLALDDAYITTPVSFFQFSEWFPKSAIILSRSTNRS